eukprot:365558-Chlamydomonas_euryale.AAC.22
MAASSDLNSERRVTSATVTVNPDFTDEATMMAEARRMAEHLRGAAAAQGLPLTSLMLQLHSGLSNAAPPDAKARCRGHREAYPGHTGRQGTEGRRGTERGRHGIMKGHGEQSEEDMGQGEKETREREKRSAVDIQSCNPLFLPELPFPPSASQPFETVAHMPTSLRTRPPACTHAHQPAHTPTSLHTCPPACTQARQPAHAHQPAHKPTSLHTRPPACTQAHKPAQKPTSLHRSPPACAQAHQPAHKPTSLYTRPPACTQAHQPAQKPTRCCTYAPSHKPLPA